MSDVDMELEGFEQTREDFLELRERYDGDGVVWVAGTTVEYGVYLEYGTEDMPPYPWFRPAIREFRRDPEGFIRDTTAYESIDAIPNTQSLVEAIATGLANRMTDNVNAQDPSGDRSPGTHPEHPKRDTGNLAASIQAVRIN